MFKKNENGTYFDKTTVVLGTIYTVLLLSGITLLLIFG